MLGSARESVNTLLLHSPAGVFELCSAGTSVVLVLLVAASWAPVSSSLSPVDSSSEDSLKKKKGEKPHSYVWVSRWKRVGILRAKIMPSSQLLLV